MHWRSAANAERLGRYNGGGEGAVGDAVAAATIVTTTAAGHELVLALQRRIDDLHAELDELEPLVGAAVLVAAAFRLRDEDGLVLALRGLVRSLRRLEERRGEGEA